MKQHRLRIKLDEKIKKVESLMWFHCNSNCVFCSWGHKRQGIGGENYAVATINEIKQDIDFAVSIGAQLFSFSGGEPTMRNDLLELISYAKSQKIKNVQIQTNGRMLAYEDYVKKLLKAGVNDFAVTILSQQENVCDQLMAAKGSYQQLQKGLSNLRKLAKEGVRLRFNIVINKLNFQELPELTKNLLKFKPSEIGYNFINIDGNVLNNPKALVPKYTDAQPYLLEALNLSAKKIWTPVFNVPHCLMNQFTGRVVDFIQPGTLLIAKDFYFSIKKNRRKNKDKLSRCRQCKYDKICFGIWQKYLNLYGDSEFKPVAKK